MEYVSGPSMRELMNEEPNGWACRRPRISFARSQGPRYLHGRGLVTAT